MIANNCNLQFVSNKKSVSPSFISLINSKHYNFKKYIFLLFIQEKQNKNTSLFCPIYKTNVPKSSSLQINSSKTHANHSYSNKHRELNSHYGKRFLLSISFQMWKYSSYRLPNSSYIPVTSRIESKCTCFSTLLCSVTSDISKHFITQKKQTATVFSTLDSIWFLTFFF